MRRGLGLRAELMARAHTQHKARVGSLQSKGLLRDLQMQTQTCLLR